MKTIQLCTKRNLNECKLIHKEKLGASELNEQTFKGGI